MEKELLGAEQFCVVYINQTYYVLLLPEAELLNGESFSERIRVAPANGSEFENLEAGRLYIDRARFYFARVNRDHISQIDYDATELMLLGEWSEKGV